jgi:5-methylthioadenosine/S-adenosylhomocysteine deaminase
MTTGEHGSVEVQTNKMNSDLIIEGGMVITMVEGEEPITEADVFVKDGRITDIRAADKEGHQVNRRKEVIDAKGSIIMPGLINTHTHAAMTLFRGLADDLPLKEWLFEKIFPAEARFLGPDTVYWGSLLGCLEMVASGTTCFADGYFFEDETVRAVHKSGLRALVAQGVIDFPAPGVEDPKENLNVARRFIEKGLGYSELIVPGIFCHSPLTCSDRTLRSACEISQEFDVPLQIHLSETFDEVNEIKKRTGKRPVCHLEQMGFLYERLIAAHAVHLDAKEMECFRREGVKVVHVPESNMKLCSGVAKISKMVKMGLTVGLGTDGCSSNNNLDLFQEMDTAAKLSKVFELDPIGLDAKTVLKMATTWGAAVLGLEDQIGTLEKGKKADIIVIDLQKPHMCPLYNPISALVYSASGADVRDVIVNGRVVMKNREFTTVDSAEVIERVKAISRDISV